MRLRVAVLAGGRSSEHEISLASARSVLESLDPERYEVVTVAIGRDGRWELGFRHDDKVLIEEFLDGIEVEVGVLGNRDPVASLPGQIVPLGHEWYDFASKYEEGGMDLVIPPDLPEEVIEHVQRVAVEAFRVTECEGMARVDCFVVGADSVVVNELNTIPGFTSTSVYAKLFDASGLSYDELLQRLIELALERQERRSKLQY